MGSVLDHVHEQPGITVDKVLPRTRLLGQAALNQLSIEVGERPWGIAVSADGGTVFTANGPSNDVSIVDVASRSVKAKVMVGDRPWGVVFVP